MENRMDQVDWEDVKIRFRLLNPDNLGPRLAKIVLGGKNRNEFKPEALKEAGHYISRLISRAWADGNISDLTIATNSLREEMGVKLTDPNF